MVLELAENIKKISPKTMIFLGGPEVSYDAAALLSAYPFVDLVVRGAGEATFLDLARHWIDQDLPLEDILGITYRAADGSIQENPPRPGLSLEQIPFV